MMRISASLQVDAAGWSADADAVATCSSVSPYQLVARGQERLLFWYGWRVTRGCFETRRQTLRVQRPGVFLVLPGRSPLLSYHKPPSKPTHIIPRVEYGSEGCYVVICPRRSLLPFEPDTPEWFAWVAKQDSFRLVGKMWPLLGSSVVRQERGLASASTHLQPRLHPASGSCPGVDWCCLVAGDEDSTCSHLLAAWLVELLRWTSLTILTKK